jgi:hypothetical protein
MKFHPEPASARFEVRQVQQYAAARVALKSRQSEADQSSSRCRLGVVISLAKELTGHGTGHRERRRISGKREAVGGIRLKSHDRRSPFGIVVLLSIAQAAAGTCDVLHM